MALLGQESLEEDHELSYAEPPARCAHKVPHNYSCAACAAQWGNGYTRTGPTEHKAPMADRVAALEEEVRELRDRTGLNLAPGVKKLHLEDGDVIVVEAERPLSPDQREWLRKDLEASFPGRECLVLCGGVELSLLRKRPTTAMEGQIKELQMWMQKIIDGPSPSCACQRCEERAALQADQAQAIESTTHVADPVESIVHDGLAEKVCTCTNPTVYGHRDGCPSKPK